jgi:anti-sigma-K factor RskA
MRPDIHTLTGAYAVDALPGAERELFEDHLEVCEACAQEVAELQATAARLGDSLHLPPPPSLRERVMAEIELTRQQPPVPAEPEGPTTDRDAGPPPAPEVAARRPADVADPGDGGTGSPGGPDRSHRATGAAPDAAEVTDLGTVRAQRAGAPRWVLAVVAPAAAVLAIAVIGLGVALANLDTRLAEMEAAAGQVTAVMTATDAETIRVDAGDTSVRIVMSASRGEAVVLVDGMAPAPRDHTYELWLIHDDVRVPAGIFDVDDRGRATRVVPGDMATVTAVGVTVEPEGGSPQPTSDPVMLVEVAS